MAQAIEEVKEFVGNDLTYTISVTNSSGSLFKIGLYQQLPNPGQGIFPVLWKAQSVQDGGTLKFVWSLNWGLTWAESQNALAGGVGFKEVGPIVAVTPLATATNGAKLTASDNTWVISASKYPNANPGDIVLATDGSFTVKDALAANLCVSVTVGGQQVSASKGIPNSTYAFSTHPTYYLAVVDYEVGQTVDTTVVTSPTQVTFSQGTTDLKYVLDDTLVFTQSATK